LQFYNTNLTRFYAPKLTHVNWVTELNNNPSMTSIIMPMLTTTGHHLQMYNNPKLIHIDLSSLEVVLGDNLNINSDLLLPRLELPALTHVEGQFHLDSNPALTSVVVPELISVGSLHFSANWGVTSLNMPKLEHCNGNFHMTPYAYVTSNMTSIHLPLLTRVEGSVAFGYLLQLATVNVAQLAHIGAYFGLDNSLVSVLSFTSLTYVGVDFSVQGNLMMTTLSIPALATVAGDVYICNNGALALPILAASVRTTAQCAFSMSGGCPALAACPSS
jgi:hypothetical protein